MDANQTPFQLVLGRKDWARCRVWLQHPQRVGQTLDDYWQDSPPDDSCRLFWEPDRGELPLRPELFRFTSSAGDRAPKMGKPDAYETSDRRGAARDRFGNWYFISKDRREVRAFSAGCKHTASFFSC